MNNTFAQLKRDIKVGDELICLYHNVEERKGQKRIVEKVNTAEVKFTNGVHLRFPISSKLVVYKEDTFSCYAQGKEFVEEKIFNEWKKGNEKLLEMGYEKHYDYMLKNPLKRGRKDYIDNIILAYSNLNCKYGESPYKYNKNIKGILLYTFRILKTSLLNNNKGE